MQLKWYACLHKEQIFILEWLKTLDSHIEHLAIIDTNMKNFPFIQLGFELTTFHVYYIQSKKYLDIQYNNSASGAEKISAKTLYLILSLSYFDIRESILMQLAQPANNSKNASDHCCD